MSCWCCDSILVSFTEFSENIWLILRILCLVQASVRVKYGSIIFIHVFRILQVLQKMFRVTVYKFSWIFVTPIHYITDKLSDSNSRSNGCDVTGYIRRHLHLLTSRWFLTTRTTCQTSCESFLERPKTILCIWNILQSRLPQYIAFSLSMVACSSPIKVMFWTRYKGFFFFFKNEWM